MFVFVALILLIGIYPAILTNVIDMGVSPITSMLVH
jgi:hypothetical protein